MASMAPLDTQTAPGQLAGSGGFVRAAGRKYYDVLRQIHEALLFDCYFEIGSRDGDSLALSRSRSVAVDPYFQVRKDVLGIKPQLSMFQCGADEFFASDFLKRNEISISFGFLDGMHLFEYLLRDFMNSERNARSTSVLALHDCCPFNHQMTTRDVDSIPVGKPWTGDVWKLIPILRQYRPELSLTVLDCWPTGLVLVTGLDAENDVLSRHYEQIVSEWGQVTLADYGVGRLFDQFAYQDAAGYMEGGFPHFLPAAIKDGRPLKPERVSL